MDMLEKCRYCGSDAEYTTVLRTGIGSKTWGSCKDHKPCMSDKQGDPLMLGARAAVGEFGWELRRMAGI